MTLLVPARKTRVSIVTSDYQKIDGYIRSLAFVPRTVFDANSAMGFVHYLRKNKKKMLRHTEDMP